MISSCNLVKLHRMCIDLSSWKGIVIPANFEAIDKDVHATSVEEAMELCVVTDWKETAES